MPFPLISTALGVCFLMVWTFIGGMVFRDGQLAARSEREMDTDILPLATRRTQPRPGATRRADNRRERPAIRAAS